MYKEFESKPIINVQRVCVKTHNECTKSLHQNPWWMYKEFESKPIINVQGVWVKTHNECTRSLSHDL